MWVGMGWDTLMAPHKGSNCHLIFRFHLISKHLSIKQLFVNKMLINLLKRVVSVSSNPKLFLFFFSLPNRVLGRYIWPGHSIYVFTCLLFCYLLLLSGLVDYNFPTLNLGGYGAGTPTAPHKGLLSLESGISGDIGTFWVFSSLPLS